MPLKNSGQLPFPCHPAILTEQMQILQDFGSDIICCTPSYAMYIGESLKAAGVDFCEAAFKSGDFRCGYGVKICARKSKGHLISKLMIFTVFQKLQDPALLLNALSKTVCILTKIIFIPRLLILNTLEVLPDGVFGELVFTCIGKEALPLVRYRTHDISALLDEKCDCGRTLVKMLKT